MNAKWNEPTPKPIANGVYIVKVMEFGTTEVFGYCYYDGKHWGRVRETEKAAEFSGSRRGTEQNFFWAEIMATKK